MDQLDVASRCFCERFEILKVDGHDLVPVTCEQHHAGVDDISQPGSGEELASGPTEWLIERADIDAPDRLRQSGLARAAAPHLPEDSGVGEREIPLEVCGLQTDPHVALVALERDQGTAIQDEAHADFALRVACRRRPRTTVALCRSARRWAAISWAVISPNSCS